MHAGHLSLLVRHTLRFVIKHFLIEFLKMKILFILVATTFVRISFASELDCKQICRDYTRRDDFATARKCNASLNLQPRDIHKACKKGRLLAFEQACLPTCFNQEWKGKIKAGDSFQACKEFANKPSPNQHLAWCRKGFDDYYKKITNDIKLQIEESHTEEAITLTVDDNSYTLTQLSDFDSFNVEKVSSNEVPPESVQTEVDHETINHNTDISFDLMTLDEVVTDSEIPSEEEPLVYLMSHIDDKEYKNNSEIFSASHQETHSNDESYEEERNDAHDVDVVSINIFQHDKSTNEKDEYLFDL